MINFVLDLIISNSHFNNDIFNIANGEKVFINDAVKTFFDNFKDVIKTEYIGKNRVGDPINWQADISKLEAIGYQQKVTFGSA